MKFHDEDPIHFSIYLMQVFDGNKDQDTVVYNELNPPITARYIRFRPVDWHGHISMRVELYGCQGDVCHISSHYKTSVLIED